ncbi:hypothetical protein M9Y10_022038 [Tritrichomonas musculus]|uniref:ubiquitinyl hydrolase 1 n=1 Tax=Tritrichomonas musculus TaxID=1915356 RepID=A0ABR2KS07_9EUKA
MADIPPREQQKETIKKIEEGSLKIGEKVCPIAEEWYSKWKYNVGYDQGTEPNYTELGPIDNTKIIYNGRLRKVVSEEQDYLLLRKESYDILEKWYTGGPTIVLDVIPDNRGRPTVVKSYIKIEANYKKDKKEIEIHKFMKISEVHKLIRSEFKVADTLKTCLRDYLNHHVSQELDDNKYVDDYAIIRGEQILLDFFEDEKWYSSTLKATFKKADVLSNQTSSFMSSIRTEAGIVGFNNLGNTCFFNSGTQCLMHTVPLMNFMLSDDKWKKDLNVTNPLGMRGELANTFASIAHQVWSGNNSVIAPRELKHIIGRYAPQFSGWGQQDSHELILFMLDGVHEDLNRCRNKPIVEPVEGDGTDDEEKSKEAWKRHKLRNDSIIVDLFHGQIRSRLICPKCHSTTVVFDPYMSIPMPINRPHTKKIKVLFVPFDFYEERKTLKIEIPSSAKKDINEIASESISTLIGKHVKVIIGARSYTDSPIKWGLQESSYSTPTYFAYEIPEDENALYIPCTIKMNSKHSYYYASKSTSKLQVPFLVDIHDLPDNFDDEEELPNFKRKVEDKLSKLWDPTYNVEETEYMKKLQEDLDPTPKEKLFKDPSEKISSTIKTNSYTYYRASTSKESLKKPTKECKYFVNAQASIVLNPESKFSFPALLQNIEPKEDEDDDAKKKKDAVDLDTCFGYFALEEDLDADNQWYCPKCKEFVCANKKLDIWKVPQILVIQLKRFIGGRWTSRKLDQYVDFPEVIDMKKYVIGPQKDKEKLNYRLFAVSNHMGGLGGGHYTACARVRDPINQTNDKGWYNFNDSSASHSSESSAHSSSAYVLFYERISE